MMCFGYFPGTWTRYGNSGRNEKCVLPSVLSLLHLSVLGKFTCNVTLSGPTPPTSRALIRMTPCVCNRGWVMCGGGEGGLCGLGPWDWAWPLSCTVPHPAFPGQVLCV